MIRVVQEEQIRSNWEELVSRGLVIREELDDHQWKLGELASQVETEYGEDSISKIATDIGIPKKTMMNYRTVYTRFANTGLKDKYPKLSFSHFKSLASSSEPEYWLNQADDNDWSVEMMNHKISEVTIKANIPEDDKPTVIRCPECGLWRLKDVPKSSMCYGHYHYEDGKVRFS